MRDVQLLELFRRQLGAGLAEGVDEQFEIAGAPWPLRSLPRRGGSVGAHCGGGRRLSSASGSACGGAASSAMAGSNSST